MKVIDKIIDKFKRNQLHFKVIDPKPGDEEE